MFDQICFPTTSDIRLQRHQAQNYIAQYSDITAKEHEEDSGQTPKDLSTQPLLSSKQRLRQLEQDGGQ